MLDHSNISIVDPCWTSIAWSLQTIYMAGNPILCDCNLYYLQQFAGSSKFPGAQCAAPIELSGQFVEDIVFHHYNCSEYYSLEEKTAQCKDLCRTNVPLHVHSMMISGRASVLWRSFGSIQLLAISLLILVNDHRE